jgi:hypothetical protein
MFSFLKVKEGKENVIVIKKIWCYFVISVTQSKRSQFLLLGQ